MATVDMNEISADIEAEIGTLTGKKLFGTDGAFKGAALDELSPELVMRIGRACAYVLSRKNRRKAKILVGRDTRASCGILESALIAGICSAGGDADLLGVVPTPAVAYLTVKYGADAGIMITASHYSFDINGIRLFSASGDRLSESVESEIERLVLNDWQGIPNAEPSSLGEILSKKNAEWDYVRYLLRDINADVGKLRVVIDCANGAASETAVKFFRGLGLNLYPINNTPDGMNINRHCGRVDPTELSKATLEARANCGIALDGDGSRCLMVDERGEVVDSDRLLALLSYHMKEQGELMANTVVVTKSANLGFFRWAKESGIVTSTAAGTEERFIHERMRSDGYNLGSDSSGRFLIGGVMGAADGELCAAKVLEVIARSHKKLSELAAIFEPYPKIDVDVRIRQECRKMWQSVPEISEMVEYCSEKLSGDGRILVVESNAEPMIRVTVEGRDKDMNYQYAHAAAKTIFDCIGEEEYSENEGE